MRNTLRTLAIAAGAATMLVAGPAFAERTIAEKAEHRVKRADADGNGTVSLAEFLAEREMTAAKKPEWGPEMTDPAKVERAFKRFDGDANGELTAAEYAAEFEKRAAK